MGGCPTLPPGTQAPLLCIPSGYVAACAALCSQRTAHVRKPRAHKPPAFGGCSTSPWSRARGGGGDSTGSWTPTTPPPLQRGLRPAFNWGGGGSWRPEPRGHPPLPWSRDVHTFRRPLAPSRTVPMPHCRCGRHVCVVKLRNVYGHRPCRAAGRSLLCAPAIR